MWLFIRYSSKAQGDESKVDDRRRRAERREGENKEIGGRKLLYTSLFKSECRLSTSIFSSAPFLPAEPRVTEVKMFGPEAMERKTILRLIPRRWTRTRYSTRSRRSMSSWRTTLTGFNSNRMNRRRPGCWRRRLWLGTWGITTDAITSHSSTAASIIRRKGFIEWSSRPWGWAFWIRCFGTVQMWSAWHQERTHIGRSTTTTVTAYTLGLRRAYTTVIRSVLGLAACPIVEIIAAWTIAAIVLPSL